MLNCVTDGNNMFTPARALKEKQKKKITENQKDKKTDRQIDRQRYVQSNSSAKSWVRVVFVIPANLMGGTEEDSFF